MEKFALLNLLKELGALSKATSAAQDGVSAPAPPPCDGNRQADAPTETVGQYNAMAYIIERHDALSNRVKNRKS